MALVLGAYDLVEGSIFINVAGKVKTPHKWQYLPVLTQGSSFCDLVLESSKCKPWHVIVEHIH